METTTEDYREKPFAKNFWLELEGLETIHILNIIKNLSPEKRSIIMNYEGVEKDNIYSKLPPHSKRELYRKNRENIHENQHYNATEKSVINNQNDDDILSKRYRRDMEMLRTEREILEHSFNNELQNLKNINQDIESKLNHARLTYSKQNEEISILNTRSESFTKQISLLEQENNALKQKQLQSKIDTEVPAFVDKAKKDLAINEKHFRLLARAWNRRGTIAVGCAAILSSIFVIYTAVLMLLSQSALNWGLYGTMLFKEMLVVSILAAFAKYAYAVGSAYTHESVKRTDRIHAIGFGKMYLEIYGSQVDQQDVKSIFENWNLNSESSFTKIKEADFENKAYNKLADAIIALTKQEAQNLPVQQSPLSKTGTTA